LVRVTIARTLDAIARLAERPRRRLCVLPHPDDESYSPAGTLHRAGRAPDAAAVHFCLTRGEASSMGPARGLAPKEVAALRSERMERVAALLHLDGMLLGDFPDGRMAYRPITEPASAIRALLDAFRPQVVIAHDPRGVNAHPDHIATHWALRHALASYPHPVRVAMIAYLQETVDAVKPRLLFPTPESEIHAAIHLTPEEIDAKERCLRIHEAFVTLSDDGPEGLLRREPIERYRFLGETRTAVVDDVFAP
jgi:LmbE family N-acetylglucosaminyl deacetylase